MRSVQHDMSVTFERGMVQAAEFIGLLEGELVDAIVVASLQSTPSPLRAHAVLAIGVAGSLLWNVRR